MTFDPLKSQWYVLHTRSRFENIVNDKLYKKDIEVFLPKITVPSRRKDRKVTIQAPLFPGYIFVRTDLDPRHHLEVLKTIGAVKLIGTHDRPVPVPKENIESLKIMVAQKENSILTGRRFRRGQRIIVIGGPFAGVTGVFVRYKSGARVVVYIQVLGQYAAVDVDDTDVEILPDHLA